jgi:hypothetical protein
MSEDHKTVALLVGIVVLVIAYMTLWPSTQTWSGEGEISMFPDGSDAKNYRLDAEIDVTEHKGIGAKPTQYYIASANWPDGGTAELDCTLVVGGNNVCTDQDNKEYAVEVTVVPEQPQSDYSEGDY